jgi:LacI family transcriptional regulator
MSNTKLATGVISVVIPVALRGDYIGAVTDAVTEHAGLHDYLPSVIVQEAGWQQHLSETLQIGGVVAVVAIAPKEPEHILKICYEHHFPVALIDRQQEFDESGIYVVGIDDYVAIRKIMQHVLGLGHERVAFITGRLALISAQQRLQAYRDALDEAGIGYDPTLVIEGDWEHESAYRRTRPLLATQTRPTAVVASNDLAAFGVLQAARELGLRVGKDLSVSGFDDISLAASVSPPLTTIRQPTRNLGITAVELLLKDLAGDRPLGTQYVELETELIIRESTGPAPRLHS